MSNGTDTLFVLTGGPGAGKTTLIEALADAGHHTCPEAGRGIIRDQMAVDGAALPWKDPALFAEMMLSWELRSHHAAAGRERPVFLDRGVPSAHDIEAEARTAAPARPSPRRLDVGQSDQPASRFDLYANPLSSRRFRRGMGHIRLASREGGTPHCRRLFRCALEVAAAVPGRVAALVLIGTKAHHRPDPQLHATALDMMEKDGFEDAWATFWAPLFSRGVNPSTINAAKAMFLRQPAEHVARGITAFHTRPSRDDILSTFAGPVTIVSGADDVAPGVAASARQANSAGAGELIVIPDCGHYVPMEKPERLNEILKDVISAQDRL